MQIASAGTSNTNVEMDETNGFKRFRHGVTEWLLNQRRIDGGWYISILRHLHVVVTTSDDLMTRDQRRTIAEACTPGDTEHYVGGGGQYPAALLPRRGKQQGRQSWSV